MRIYKHTPITSFYGLNMVNLYTKLFPKYVDYPSERIIKIVLCKSGGSQENCIERLTPLLHTTAHMPITFLLWAQYGKTIS